MNRLAEKRDSSKDSPMKGPSESRGSESTTFHFMDNRLEALVQRRFQESADNSTHAIKATQLQAIADSTTTQPERDTATASKSSVSNDSQVVQMVRGTPRTYLRNDQYPRKPALIPHQTRSGPYTVTDRMEAWLVPGQLQGGAQVDTKFWLDVHRRNAQDQFSDLDYGYYQRGHVLARSLGGPAHVKNMLPLTHTANYHMRDNPEVTVRNYLRKSRKDPVGVVHYVATVNFGGHNTANISDAEKSLPNNVNIVARIHHSPAQYGDLGDMAKWQATDPEPGYLYNNDSPMNLVDFDSAYPNHQYTIESIELAKTARQGFLNRNDGVVKGRLAQKNRGAARAMLSLINMGKDNGEDPRIALTALREDLQAHQDRIDATIDVKAEVTLDDEHTGGIGYVVDVAVEYDGASYVSLQADKPWQEEEVTRENLLSLFESIPALQNINLVSFTVEIV